MEGIEIGVLSRLSDGHTRQNLRRTQKECGKHNLWLTVTAKLSLSNKGTHKEWDVWVLSTQVLSWEMNPNYSALPAAPFQSCYQEFQADILSLMFLSISHCYKSLSPNYLETHYDTGSQWLLKNYGSFLSGSTSLNIESININCEIVRLSVPLSFVIISLNWFYIFHFYNISTLFCKYSHLWRAQVGQLPTWDFYLHKMAVQSQRKTNKMLVLYIKLNK